MIRAVKEGAGLNNRPSRARDGKRGPVMAEAIAERVRRYILDGSDEDLRRLLGVAETTPGDGPFCLPQGRYAGRLACH